MPTHNHQTTTSDDEPIIVNGIQYANKGELQRRIESDANAMAEFLYDMYREHKAKQAAGAEDADT